jgi:hypothetical protein
MRVRRAIGVIAAALVAVVGAAAPIAQATQEKAAAPVSVTGKWQTTLEMEVGTASVVLVFKQDGEKLTGTYTGRYGEYPLLGKVADGKLEFVVTIIAEGTETKMYFEGAITNTPQGVLLKGSADLGGMGAAGWFAKKQS